MVTKEELANALRDELVDVWNDLDSARGRSLARPGQRSMEMGWLVERIESMSRLVGPASWEEVPVSLLESGLFQLVNRELGLQIDEAAINEWLRTQPSLSA